MIRHESHIRVRYAETDQMGVVYHGNFAAYFEVARAEMIRHFGLTYQEMEARGVIMPVTEMTFQFRRPARYDELLTLRSAIRELPAKRLTVETEVYNPAGDLLVSGAVSLAFLDRAQGRSITAPDFFLDLIQQHWTPEN